MTAYKVTTHVIDREERQLIKTKLCGWFNFRPSDISIRKGSGSTSGWAFLHIPACADNLELQKAICAYLLEGDYCWGGDTNDNSLADPDKVWMLWNAGTGLAIARKDATPVQF